MHCMLTGHPVIGCQNLNYEASKSPYNTFNISYANEPKNVEEHSKNLFDDVDMTF